MNIAQTERSSVPVLAARRFLERNSAREREPIDLSRGRSIENTCNFTGFRIAVSQSIRRLRLICPVTRLVGCAKFITRAMEELRREKLRGSSNKFPRSRSHPPARRGSWKRDPIVEHRFLSTRETHFVLSFFPFYAAIARHKEHTYVCLPAHFVSIRLPPSYYDADRLDQRGTTR